MKATDYQRAYYLANRERIRANVRARRAAMTPDQKAIQAAQVAAWCKANPERRREIARLSARRRKTAKNIAQN